MNYLDKLTSAANLNDALEAIVMEEIRKNVIKKYTNFSDPINLFLFTMGLVSLFTQKNYFSNYIFYCNICLLIFNGELKRINPKEIEYAEKNSLFLHIIFKLIYSKFWERSLIAIFIMLFSFFILAGFLIGFNILSVSFYFLVSGFILTILLVQHFEPRIAEEINKRQATFHDNFHELDDLKK
ncbi:hypothetical protein [Companilactobacillus muriivasis]|uniref:hypothetical protein n=1 Tax=Companilactobacillus muriivasis TaxID=3081444 RepID=UPI0030C674C9